MIKIIGNAMRIYVNNYTHKYEICMYVYIYILLQFYNDIYFSYY